MPVAVPPAAVPGDVLPSPQLHVDVCVSADPGSVNGALAVTAAPTGTGSAGAVIAPTDGGTFATLTVTSSGALAALPSWTTRRKV